MDLSDFTLHILYKDFLYAVTKCRGKALTKQKHKEDKLFHLYSGQIKRLMKISHFKQNYKKRSKYVLNSRDTQS